LGFNLVADAISFSPRAFTYLNKKSKHSGEQYATAPIVKYRNESDDIWSLTARPQRIAAIDAANTRRTIHANEMGSWLNNIRAVMAIPPKMDANNESFNNPLTLLPADGSGGVAIILKYALGWNVVQLTPGGIPTATMFRKCLYPTGQFGVPKNPARKYGPVHVRPFPKIVWHPIAGPIQYMNIGPPAMRYPMLFDFPISLF